MNKAYTTLLVSLILVMLAIDLQAQKWEFIKEKEGIKIYTRKDAGSVLKSFRGEADLQTTMEKVCNLIGNCLLYTSPSPRDRTRSRMPSSA